MTVGQLGAIEALSPSNKGVRTQLLCNYTLLPIQSHRFLAIKWSPLTMPSPLLSQQPHHATSKKSPPLCSSKPTTSRPLGLTSSRIIAASAGIPTHPRSSPLRAGLAGFTRRHFTRLPLHPAQHTAHPCNSHDIPSHYTPQLSLIAVFLTHSQVPRLVRRESVVGHRSTGRWNSNSRGTK